MVESKSQLFDHSGKDFGLNSYQKGYNCCTDSPCNCVAFIYYHFLALKLMIFTLFEFFLRFLITVLTRESRPYTNLEREREREIYGKKNKK